ncbi:molybdopterin molybdotransferase MoeA [Arthrobacter sp. zg-Y1219]|uniref:molybdopterin molybdotransferase MoeA n=1 Tax=Arthrobacter sp. zg-Y1219 TaxID=3049067 RepID=UPI0024C354CE|nr:gephyrin-like molybdotransferase Glp [Arthrobacter sp. zg-Y1219]MDK1360361.1 molybdopterin molybdotransferase MoeA [Arthrobacter sp. zg-Y1219]
MTRTVEEHQQAVLRLLERPQAPVRTEIRELVRAAGRVLAADVRAPRSLPPFDNSQMDGYAVRAADLAASGAAAPASSGGATTALPVTTPIPAGIAAPALPPRAAAPIMTGAMLPAGADAVVPIERAVPAAFFSEQELPGATVRLPAEVAAGEYVRAAGSDIRAGAVALTAGTRLGAAQLGLLAALGIPAVEVRAPFRVLLLSTGDEVVEPGRPLAPGQIHDANTTLLAVSLQEAGAEVVRSRIVADSPEVFLSRLRDDLARHAVDLVLTSGGISKGAYEVVRLALDTDGVQFLSVAMQPGGPQGIGTVDGVPFLGFPGNPVSSLVSFEMFLRPALGTLTGRPAPRPQVPALLAEDAVSPPAKHQVRRGRYFPPAEPGARGRVELIGGAGSHLVHALASSNALVHLPAGVETVPAGAEVAVWLLD